MLIQCTKSLLDKTGIKGSDLTTPEGYEDYPNSLMAWHANFVSFGKRKAIVLMNNETRYPVVIYRPTTKEFSKIKVTIQKAIREALRMEGIKEEVIDAYFSKAGEISFSKTGSRSMLSKLNNAVREVEHMQEYIEEDTKIQRYISLVAGRMIQLSGNEPGFYPFEKMVDCLGKLTAAPVMDVSLYRLKIKLVLEGHDIWRRVLIPSTYSFRHLHNTIQTVFDWHDSHIHEFEVEREEDKPIRIIMNEDPETIEYIDIEEFEVLQERVVSLEDILPKYKEIKYEYDFGDSWIHTITLENIEKGDELVAKYLEGAGERPPEDVGGEGGYEEYLKIMGDPSHPDYAYMLEWAKGQRERRLLPQQINKHLKSVPKGYQYSMFRL